MRWTDGLRAAAQWGVLAVLSGLSTPLPGQQAPPAPSPPPPSAQFTVVIDAAHGGDDTGGHLNDGSLEKSATLAMSVRLRSLLNARGIHVVTTREADQSLDPGQRAAIANRANAQACLSLHIAETGSGVHLFSSSLTPTIAVRFAPWRTAQAGWVTRSLALAGALNATLGQAQIPVTLGRTALPGIDSMTCPAVAIELAPERSADRKTISEPDDPNYQAKVAATLATALLAWRAEPHQP